MEVNWKAKFARKVGHRYRKGHPYFAPRQANLSQDSESTWLRLSREEFGRVAKLSPDGTRYEVPGADGNQGTTKLLRPAGDTAPEVSVAYLQEADKSCSGEMRLVHREKMCTMFNTAIREHGQYKGACGMPSFYVWQELQKGMAWKVAVACRTCGYKGSLHQLYDTVPKAGRGAKAAAVNHGLQVGLLDSPIGNTKAQVVVAALNTPPPSLKGMMKTSYAVCSRTVTQAEDDLHRIRRQMVETNKARGLPAKEPVNISIDTRYNSDRISCRNKAGQSASQAVGIAIENQTDQHRIVGVHLQNKLCWVGAYLRSRGFTAECPGGHIACTANTAQTDPLSEHTIGQRLGDLFAEDGIFIKYVTTDGDARTAEGVALSMRKMAEDWVVLRQADTTHLGQSQFRHTLKATFNNHMFPGETAAERQEQQRNFGLDIKSRCHAIFKQLFIQTNGNVATIASKMADTIECTLNCYGGDCSRCRFHSVVCNGGSRKNWWSQSCYLKTGGLKRGMINMTAADKVLLRQILNMKLSFQGLHMMRHNTNTNKNESINRAISASAPKNVNFSRAAEARIHKAVHRINHGAGNSLLIMLQAAGCAISRGGRVAKAIRRMQERFQYQREYRRRSAVKRHKMHSKFQQRRGHWVAKQHKYRKGQLDTLPIQQATTFEEPQPGPSTQPTYSTSSSANIRQHNPPRPPQPLNQRKLRPRTPKTDHNYAYSAKTDHTYSQ